MAIAGGVVGALVAGSGLPGRLWPAATAEAATHHVRAITAEQFILVDRTGIKRAELVMERGEPLLEFYGPTGKIERASIGVDLKGTARARFYSSTGISQAALGVTGEGRAGLALLDPDGKTRAAMVLSNDNSPSLTLYGADGKPIRSLP